MKKYREYMDGIRASETLHRRLAELEGPGKRAVPWKKYGALAAALALVMGTGIWGMRAGLPWAGYDERLVDWAPENATAGVPDIAPVEPSDATELGRQTLGGYDVTQGGIVTHYILPSIDYGNTGLSEVSGCLAMDWDIPQGAARRDLTREEIAALLGGEDALSTHLNWDGYELTGWAAWYEGGSFWGAYIQGHAGPLDHFEFAVTADQLPPTCIAYPSSVEQEVNGVTVTADGHDSTATPSGGVDASTRRVSFMKGDYGYRFDLTGTSRALTEERVSRLVRLVADQGIGQLDWDGTYTCSICGRNFPVGSSHGHPFLGVGEPNWDDSGEGWTCPDCGQTFTGDGWRAHVHSFTGGDDGPASAEPYDPNEAADPSYNAFLACRHCGGEVPDGMGHYCEPDPAGSGGYLCGLCGEVFPEGKVHSHEMCRLPLAPIENTCEVCGQTLPEGVEHSHQEDHHASHH